MFFFIIIYFKAENGREKFWTWFKQYPQDFAISLCLRLKHSSFMICRSNVTIDWRLCSLRCFKKDPSFWGKFLCRVTMSLALWPKVKCRPHKFLFQLSHPPWKFTPFLFICHVCSLGHYFILWNITNETLFWKELIMHVSNCVTSLTFFW